MLYESFLRKCKSKLKLPNLDVNGTDSQLLNNIDFDKSEFKEGQVVQCYGCDVVYYGDILKNADIRKAREIFSKTFHGKGLINFKKLNQYRCDEEPDYGMIKVHAIQPYLVTWYIV